MSGMDLMRGRVIRIRGAEYIVAGGFGEVACSLRGKFRLGESPEEVLPVVGDDVEIRVGQGANDRGRQGLVMGIGPRGSVFVRSDPSGRTKFKVIGANLDYVFIVVSVKEPSLKPRLIDRMIVSAEHGEMEPVVCINKVDLARDVATLKQIMVPYDDMGYRVVYCSAANGTGIEELRELMQGKTSMLVGPSGSGKTSIVNALQPNLTLRTGDVSGKTGKGKHTTSHFELHPLDFGGFIGDSPGVREFGISRIEPVELAHHFRDFGPHLGHCRFSSCTHSHEPECGIKEAVERGDISSDRYESYMRILESLPKE
jgi:ribosome biogenesis GTPase